MKLNVLILVAVPTLGGCSFLGDLPGKASRTDTSTYALVSRTGRVELGTFNGAIEVRRGGGTEVRIERTTTCRAPTDEEAQRDLDLVVPAIVIEEALVSYKVSDPRVSRRRLSVSLVAQVPEEANLVLDTSNGAIAVEGVRGEIDARTSNGKIAVRDGGRSRVVLHTSNGEIACERLAGSLEARTRNGRVTMSGCPGPIAAETSNGTVAVDCSAGLAGNLSATTSNGGIRCVLPVSFAGELEAGTSNGRVDCRFPVNGDTRLGPRSSSVRGRVGAGGPSVRLSTSNGGIDIHRGLSAEAPPAPPVDAEDTRSL